METFHESGLHGPGGSTSPLYLVKLGLQTVLEIWILFGPMWLKHKVVYFSLRQSEVCFCCYFSVKYITNEILLFLKINIANYNLLCKLSFSHVAVDWSTGHLYTSPIWLLGKPLHGEPTSNLEIGIFVTHSMLSVVY
jgi:hypothetical protein